MSWWGALSGLLTAGACGPSPQQGPFRNLLDMKTEKRLAGWKERRSRYGDINMNKCYQLGQVFTPFRALATMVSSLFFWEGFRSPLVRPVTDFLWDGCVRSGHVNAAQPTSPKLSGFPSQASVHPARLQRNSLIPLLLAVSSQGWREQGIEDNNLIGHKRLTLAYLKVGGPRWRKI